MIIFQTSLGNIEITLDTENTPITAQNFIDYVKAEHYNGTIFHRVIHNFMIQGGGLNEDMSERETRDSIENEADLGGKNVRGSVAMARTSNPHSATSQFFINVVDNDFLNFKSKDQRGWGYCVFGQVTSGMDVVDQIKAVETTRRAGHSDVPANPIIIEKVFVSEKTKTDSELSEA